jgi:hypothetical protein
MGMSVGHVRGGAVRRHGNAVSASLSPCGYDPAGMRAATLIFCRSATITEFVPASVT